MPRRRVPPRTRVRIIQRPAPRKMIWTGFAGGVAMGAITAVMLTAGGDEPAATAAGIDSQQLADMLPGLVKGLVDQQLADDPALGPELPLLDDPYDVPVDEPIDMPLDMPLYEPAYEPSSEPDTYGDEPVYVEVPVVVPVVLDSAPVDESEFVPAAESMVVREEDVVPFETFEEPAAGEPVPTEPYSAPDPEVYIGVPYDEEASSSADGTTVSTVSTEMIEGDSLDY